MKTSDSTAAISPALVRLHTMIENPAKTQRVQAGAKRYSFAPLPDILDIVRPMLALHGLAVIQEAASDQPGVVAITTRLLHTSGEWIEYERLVLAAGDGAPQDAGSAITYARRYALTAALGIAADEDDDGAVGAPARKTPPSRPRAAAADPAPLSGGTAEPDAGPEGAVQATVVDGEGAQSPAPSAPSGSLHTHEYAPKVDRPGWEVCLMCGKARRASEVPS